MEFKELCDESSEGDAEDLDSVKALTEKLKLQTRRPSYLEWQERVQSRPWASSAGRAAPAAHREQEPDLAARNICGFNTIDDALAFLRKELVSCMIPVDGMQRRKGTRDKDLDTSVWSLH